MTRGPAARALAVGLLVLAGAGWTASAGDLAVTITPARPRPGDLVLIHAKAAPADVHGEWAGRALRFFPVRDGMAALAGIDLDVAPGPLAWRLLRRSDTGGARVLRAGSVAVQARTFDTQRLTLPPGQVDLDAETFARVRAEQAELRAMLAGGAAERLWRGPFRIPIEGGQPTGGFGLRRIINGQTRSPHAGYDWAAPRGTPVLAVNDARVALVAEHVFAGRLVVLDHGLGLFTLYFHLDDARVTADEGVTRGQPIGSVGATGRATGPHLHLGVSLGGARVDPMALLGLVPPPDGS